MEYNILIKIFAIILCNILIFSKITNINLIRRRIIILIPLLFFTTIISYWLRIFSPPLNLLIIYLSIFAYILIVHKKDINSSIIISTITFALNFLIYAVAFTFSLPIAYILFASISSIHIRNIYFSIIIAIIQVILILLLFKIKRFRKGIIALEDKFNNDLGVILSLITLLITSLNYTSNNDYRLGTIVLFILLIISLLMYFYFKKHITNRYISKVQKRNTEILENELSEQKQAVANLTTQNEELSKIIHRDNKLIPAMLLAVEEILKCESTDEQKEKSYALLPQLKTMAEERTGILNKYEKDNKQLPTTGFVSLDSSLKYLLNKAKEKDISLDLSVTTSIKYLSSVIEENDLNTLILDLVENAIIATSTADIRNILIIMGTENENLCISIYDSGDHFDPRVIANLGIKRITTHKKTGGSGIGMMTTFEILKKYQGSFIINERIENRSYTKEIKLLFDKQNENRILTDREEIKNIISKRKDIISN